MSPDDGQLNKTQGSNLSEPAQADLYQIQGHIGPYAAFLIYYATHPEIRHDAYAAMRKMKEYGLSPDDEKGQIVLSGDREALLRLLSAEIKSAPGTFGGTNPPCTCNGWPCTCITKD